MATPTAAPNVNVLPDQPPRGAPRAEFTAGFNVFLPALTAFSAQLNESIKWLQTVQNTVYSDLTASDSTLSGLADDLNALSSSLNALTSSFNSTQSSHDNRLTTAETELDDVSSRQTSVETLLQDNLPSLDVAAAEQADVDRAALVLGNLNRQVELIDSVNTLQKQMTIAIDGINLLSERLLDGAHAYKEL